MSDQKEEENPLLKFSDDQIVEEYMRQRSLKEASTADYKKRDATYSMRLTRLGNELLRRMQERKNTGFRTKFGSVYQETELKPSAADWGVIYDWVMADETGGRFGIFEKRLTRTFIKDYMEDHGTIDEETGKKEMGDPPPGVNVLREQVARVRKS